MQRQFKYTKQQIQILQDFINSTIDKDIKVKVGNAYECDIENKTIYLGSKELTTDTILFIQWLKTTPEYTPISYNLISILHEIGHIKTYNKIKSKQREVMYGIYSFLNEMQIVTTETLNQKYFEIPDEKDATNWGLRFYVNNKSKCDKLVKDLQIM